jgi:hypothetical protein
MADVDGEVYEARRELGVAVVPKAGVVMRPAAGVVIVPKAGVVIVPKVGVRECFEHLVRTYPTF